MTATANDDSPTPLEQEWAELGGGWFGGGGARANEERPSLWLFPVLLLYTGFFFGPFVTAVAAVITLRGRIGLRTAAIVLGACGAAWCLLQGLSLYNAAWWSELELQSMRAGINFVAGSITYAAVRPDAVRRYRQSLRTLWTSLAIVALLIVAWLLLPATVLVAMGR